MGKNRVKKEDFSTGEIPVSTGPVPALSCFNERQFPLSRNRNNKLCSRKSLSIEKYFILILIV